MKRALVMCLLGGLLGCGRAPGWLERAREAHARADAALARHDPSGARAALMAFLAEPPPRTIAAEDQRRVLQDVLYRVAELAPPREGVGWADRGLALGARVDLFTANLWIARGHAHEALGEPRAAADDYHRALVIDDTLLHEETER